MLIVITEKIHSDYAYGRNGDIKCLIILTIDKCFAGLVILDIKNRQAIRARDIVLGEKRAVFTNFKGAKITLILILNKKPFLFKLVSPATQLFSPLHEYLLFILLKV